MSDARDRDDSLERLLRKATPMLGGTRSPEACLDAETVAAWAGGGLSDDELARAQEHTAGCTRCQSLVAMMVRIDPATAVDEVKAPASRAWIGWLVPLTAAAGVTLFWLTRPPDAPLGVPAPPAAPTETVALGQRDAAPPTPPVPQSAATPEAASATGAPAAPAASPAARRFETPADPASEARAQMARSAGRASDAEASARRADTQAKAADPVVPGGLAQAGDNRSRSVAAVQATGGFGSAVGGVASGLPAPAATSPPAPPPPPPAPVVIPTMPLPVQTPTQAQAGATPPQTQAATPPPTQGAQSIPPPPPQSVAESVVVAAPTTVTAGGANAAFRAGAGGGRGGAAGRGGGAGGGGGAANAARTALSTVPAESGVVDVASPDSTVRWRANVALVERSADGGATWQFVARVVDADFRAASSPSPLVCWLVGRDGVVVVFTEGRTARAVTFPELVHLVGVRATDERTAIVTTANGRQYGTSDGGLSWSVR